MNTTATATAPSVKDLANAWAATATPAELAAVEQMCLSYVRAHGTGILTTDECRSVYRLLVQQGKAQQNGQSFAYAIAVQTAVTTTPYGSLSAWDKKQTRIADKAAARKEKAAAARATRAAAATEGRETPRKATAHAGCDHEATPRGRKLCRNARKAAAAAQAA